MKITDARVQTFLAELRAHGNQKRAAEIAGVSRSSLRHLAKTSPEFAREWKQAKIEGDQVRSAKRAEAKKRERISAVQRSKRSRARKKAWGIVELPADPQTAQSEPAASPTPEAQSEPAPPPVPAGTYTPASPFVPPTEPHAALQPPRGTATSGMQTPILPLGPNPSRGRFGDGDYERELKRNPRIVKV